MRNSTLRRASVAAALLVTGGFSLTACGSDSPSTATDPETTAAATTRPAAPATTEAPTQTPTAPVSSSTAPGAETLITLETPASGATVSGTLHVKGTANSPEANVPWTLTDATGKKVAAGAFTAEGWMDKLYPYAGTVNLKGVAPGDYSFEVEVDDDSDGEGSAAGQSVGVSITVR